MLIGNFNDELGFINAFDAVTGDFGTMLSVDGNPLIIPYLWGLVFGNGELSDKHDLYFAAGIGDELHGLFGEIDAVSEPGTAALMLLAMAGLFVMRQRRALEPRGTLLGPRDPKPKSGQSRIRVAPREALARPREFELSSLCVSSGRDRAAPSRAAQACRIRASFTREITSVTPVPGAYEPRRVNGSGQRL